MEPQLNRHLIKDLATYLTGRQSGITLLATESVLTEYFADDLVITWNVDDVIHVANEHDIYDFYVDDAQQVLLLAEQKMDAGLGINWDMLWIYTQEYLERRDEGHPVNQTESTSANPPPRA